MQTLSQPLRNALSWQALGNGYRIYNTALMRCHSPDDFSPFGRGGLNAYAFGRGDPINHIDPSGHISLKVMSLVSIFIASGSTMGSIGVAVSTKDEVQRGFVIAAAVFTIAAASTAGYYIYAKRNSKIPASRATGAAVQPVEAPTAPSAPAPPPYSPTPSRHSMSSEVSRARSLNELPGPSPRSRASSPPENSRRVGLEQFQDRQRLQREQLAERHALEQQQLDDYQVWLREDVRGSSIPAHVYKFRTGSF